MTAGFEFEGVWYVVPVESAVYAEDVIQLPDGRFVDVSWFESLPPVAKSVTLSDGPTDIGGHIGQVWQATRKYNH